jgi:hypothetical protein
MVYGFYVASEDDNTQEVTLKIALLCSMYIILEMGYNMSPRIAVLASNIPILLYYIKDKPKTGFLMSMVYVYVCSKYFYIKIYITIAQYVLLLIFYIVYKKTHKNKYIFVTCFFIVKFIVYLIRRNETECFFDDHAFEDDLYKLGAFIGKLKNLKALDVLPYHTMGVAKYKEMGIDYPLKDIDALPLEKAIKAKEHILRGINDARKNHK